MSSPNSTIVENITQVSNVNRHAENEFSKQSLLEPGIKKSLKLESYDKDHRQYQYLELENGLKVLLIEDNRAKVAGSTLYLNVGAKDDPPEHPGLIHFLEHMVFMGSEEFPDEKEFEEFVTRNSGYRNGLTYPDHTEFPMQIVHEKFDEALKKFSAFIKSPLLKPSCVTREVKSVHEEFMSDLQNDSRRVYYISTLLMNPKHPNHRYFPGNEESLRDLDSIFPKLKSLHQEHYVADRMTLILRSKHSLKELENFAIQYFSSIRKSRKSENIISEPTCTQNELGNKVYIQSVQKHNVFFLIFVLNGRRTIALMQALRYIRQLLNNQEKDGLSDTLKRMGLIQDGSHSGNFSVSLGMVDDFQFGITVSLPLTMDGIKRIDEITIIVLSYFDFLKRQGIKAHYFKEFQEDNARLLRFQADSHEPDFFENIKYYDLKYFFRGDMILEDSIFPEELIHEILSQISPKNMRQTLILDAPEQDASWKIEPRTKTKDNHIKYKIMELSSLLASWQRDSKEVLDLPFKISEGFDFRPNDFHIKPQSENFIVPRLIFNQNGMTVWYSQDLHFKQATINTTCYLISHLIRNNVSNAAARRFFVAMIESVLMRHLSESLKRANANFNIGHDERGLSFSFSGYSDKHNAIISKAFDLLMSFEIDPDEFALHQKSLIESCKASKTDSAIEQCDLTVELLLNALVYPDEDLLIEYEKMTIQKLKEYIMELFKNFKLEMYCHGNFTQEETIELAIKISEKLNISEASTHSHYPPRSMIVKLPEGSNFHFLKKVEHLSQAVVVFFQAPDNTQMTQAKLLIIEKLMKSSFFQQLRGVEQLGYNVDCSMEDVEDYEGLKFHIESSKYPAEYLLQRIELFIRVFAKALDDLVEERFIEISHTLQTLIEQTLSSPSSSAEYAEFFEGRFENNKYRFKEIFKMLQNFKQIDLATIKKFYKELTHPSSMRKLVVMTDDNVSFKSIEKSDVKVRQEALNLKADKKLAVEPLHANSEGTLDEEELEKESDCEEMTVNCEEVTVNPSEALDISKYYLEQEPHSEGTNVQLVQDVLQLRKTLACFPDHMSHGRNYLQSIVEFNSLRSALLNQEEGFVEVAPEELFQALQAVSLAPEDQSFSNITTASADLIAGNLKVSDVILTYCFDRYKLRKDSSELAATELGARSFLVIS